MNEVLNTIANRHTTRAFIDKAVSEQHLRLIAEAAIQSPSGMNRQHWQVVVVKNKQLIADMESEGMRMLGEFPDKTMYNRIMSRGGKLFYNADSMIFVGVKMANPQGAELIDLGIVSQSIALAATSLGVQSCICGLVAFAFAGSRGEEFKKRLALADGYECGLCVLLGYEETEVAPHQPDTSKITVIE